MMKKALGMTACVVAGTALTIIAAVLFFGLAFSVFLPDRSILPSDGSVGARGWPLGALAIFTGGLHGPMLGHEAGQRILKMMDHRVYGAPVLTGLLVAIGVIMPMALMGMDGAFEAVSYYGPVSLLMIVLFGFLVDDTARHVKIWATRRAIALNE